MNLIILVLDSFTSNSIRNSKIQKKTWANDASRYTNVLFYKGGKETKRDGFELILDCSDKYEDMGIKTLKAFNWVFENLNFDYIFRTNTSSYVNYENLIEYVNNLAKKEIDYCGFIGSYEDINYVSGSGIILSRHAVQKILNSRNKFDETLVEDIAIGKLLKSISILPTTGNRQDIESHSDIINLELNQYHIRCRLDSFGYSRNIEKYILSYVYKKFNRTTKLEEIFIVFLMKINKLILINQKRLKKNVKKYFKFL